ncbi:MAG: hypothetical protein BAJALOKI2v1_20082 [Promethearchaeota archaeon]|nr:MAG: hypothetical protein BAJALOKI2v1_20082 [Candidatus Lokiarchaeota archaeon]
MKMSYKIVVDLSHNESVEFPEFTLGEEDYEVEYIDKTEGSISFKDLEDFDILFIGNIQHTEKEKKDKFTPDELKAIKKFVGEGGGLLLTSGAGGDQDIPMKKGSIRVLYKITGVKRFWNGVIQETSSNFLVKKENILVNDLYSHPISKGVTEVVFPNSTFFTITEEDVEDIVVSSEKAEFEYFKDHEVDQIGSVPICVTSEFYSGRSVTLGSSDFLMESIDFGIDAGDNIKFLENIIKWLVYEI